MFVCNKFKIYLCLDTILLPFKQIHKTYPNTYYSNNQKYCLILNTLCHDQQCNRSLSTFIINDDLQNYNKNKTHKLPRKFNKKH